MSKIIKNATEWLNEIDEGACTCEMGFTPSGLPYHAIECVITSAQIVRKLVSTLKIREAELRPDNKENNKLLKRIKLIKAKK